jgi:hypothetical protein
MFDNNVRKLRDCLRWARIRCETAGRPVPQITVPGLLKMWERQHGRCALTDVALKLSGPHGATLDRINPKRGYQRDNVVSVSKRANQAKGDMTIREFRQLCRRVLAI